MRTVGRCQHGIGELHPWATCVEFKVKRQIKNNAPIIRKSLSNHIHK
jgi:hypothetical protein